MTGFRWLSPLTTRPLKKPEIDASVPHWFKPDYTLPWVRLIVPMRGYSDITGKEFEIPAGFAYDQATVPWWVRWRIRPDSSTIARAACLHDYRCPFPDKDGNYVPDPSQGEVLGYIEAAEEMRRGMLADGAWRIRANAVYWAIKNFGPRWR